MLETERLIIRQFRETDHEDLYEYLSLEGIYRFEPGQPVSPEEAKAIASERAAGEFFLAVTLKENGKLIGHVSLFPSGSEQFATREMGYIFNPAFQNKGYCTEAVRAVTEYAFDTLKAHRVVAFCSPENTASWRVLEKCGMTCEARYKQNAYFRTDEQGNPLWFDSLEYAIIEPDFRKLHADEPSEQITLRPIDRSNWKECIALAVHEEQKRFIIANMYSLAEAKANPTFIPLAAYHNDVMVGFIMYGPDTDTGNYHIHRLMIDKHHQKKGYGKIMLKHVIERLITNPHCTSLYISHVPDNVVADRLYTSVGFLNTGRIIEGETEKFMNMSPKGYGNG